MTPRRPCRRPLRRLAAACLLLLAVPAPGAAVTPAGASPRVAAPGAARALPGEDGSAAARDAAAASVHEMLLAVRLNGRDTGQVALLLRSGARLLARGLDLREWRLRRPDVAPVMHGGDDYYPLDALPGLAYSVDGASQSLDVQAPPTLFESTVIGDRAPPPVPDRVSPGGFLNYDLSAWRAAGRSQVGSLLEIGAFNGWGTAESRFVVRRGSAGKGGAVRLDTTWTRDFPGHRATLRFGDAVSRPGHWGDAVRFGGLQWGTNFGTQPYFVAFPLPSMAGEAALPSTVELYVDGALRLREEVPGGPFTLRDLPVTTGQGEARLVVRDVLGREHVVTQGFHASPRLLRPGLHDYSVEAGFVRQRYGLASGDYGAPMAAATQRVGLSERFTAEVHGQWMASRHAAAGFAGTLLLPGVALLQAGLAASRGAGRRGGLATLGFERQSRRLSVGGRLELASRHFARLGSSADRAPPRRVGQLHAGVSVPPGGSLGLSWLRTDDRGRGRIDVLSLGYHVGLGQAGHLGVSVLRLFGAERGSAVALSYTVALGTRLHAGVNLQAADGRRHALLSLRRHPPAGDGYGWHLLSGPGNAEGDVLDAGVHVRHGAGIASLELARRDGAIGTRARVAGGLALLGGGLHAARPIDGSFALVQAGQPGVTVYADRQPVARTDAAGTALVPGLRAYERNRLGIEPAELPLDVRIGATEVEAVPAYRSGLLVPFDAQRVRSALLRIVADDGRPVPAGARAVIRSGSEVFPVGLDGRLYLSGLAVRSRVRVSWAEGRCELELSLPPTDDPQPDLGTQRCKEVLR